MNKAWWKRPLFRRAAGLVLCVFLACAAIPACTAEDSPDAGLRRDVMDQMAGSWILEAGGSFAEDHLVLDADGTFLAAGWNDSGSGSDRDCIPGTWAVTDCPAGADYWNTPPYQLTLRYEDGRTAACGLTTDGETFGLSDFEGSAVYVRRNPEEGMTFAEFMGKWKISFSGLISLYAYYQDLIGAKGPFDSWPPEEQYEFARMLDDVSESPELRDIFAQEGWIDSASVAYEISQWRYALPKDVRITAETAVEKAREFLVTIVPEGMDTADWTASASLYAGHWYRDPFASPWWVIRFRSAGEKTTEVWVNADTGDMPAHDTRTVIEAGAEAFLQAEENADGQVPDEDIYLSSDITAVYLEEEGNWQLEIRHGSWSFWEIPVNDITLESPGAEISNG